MNERPQWPNANGKYKGGKAGSCGRENGCAQAAGTGRRNPAQTKFRPESATRPGGTGAPHPLASTGILNMTARAPAAAGVRHVGRKSGAEGVVLLQCLPGDFNIGQAGLPVTNIHAYGRLIFVVGRSGKHPPVPAQCSQKLVDFFGCRQP